MGISKRDYPDIKWVLSEYGEFPSFYSDTACRIISNKYFTKGETSLFELAKRTADAVAASGWEQGYFDDGGEREQFGRELAGLTIRQEAWMNSPYYFNVGVDECPQVSACFIQGVEDTMESILSLASKEGMLFKYGSGTGTNFSTLRGKSQPLSSGGSASGVIEFMKMFDAGAGVIKSGGKTRRAAKMVILDHDHPDINEFIRCKADEEKLVRGGLDPERAWFQNGNNTVRVSDNVMANSCSDGPEKELLTSMAQAAWECGDPGIQFHDTINVNMPAGLTCRASNPCGEYMFIDDSACNLASINLVKCLPGTKKFKAAVRTLITAMDIIVEMSSYPSPEIEANSHKYRPLGLGYTNLGTYLMNHGVAYGSEAACLDVQEITRIMHGLAEEASLELAKRLGSNFGGELRNAQLTLLAPTGTISFAMDCESTGIEPVFAEESHKQLVGGGTIVAVPRCINDAEARGDEAAIKVALSTDPARNVTPLAHLDMMAAAQEYLSGAISKTVNMPADCTVQDIFDIYLEAWHLGLKGVAVYRDGCKAAQPLTTKPASRRVEGTGLPFPDTIVPPAVTAPTDSKGWFFTDETANWVPSPRAKMPLSRKAIVHKVSIAGISTYITIGLYPDGTPGEVFISMSTVGSTIRGWADNWATLLSIALQSGVPLDKLIKKFRGTKFEPSGFTGREDVKYVDSVVDCVMQLLERVPVGGDSVPPELDDQVDESKQPTVAVPCAECGADMVRTGSCYTCPACGHNRGGCS